LAVQTEAVETLEVIEKILAERGDSNPDRALDPVTV
jgi:hypothetical protein